MNIFYSNFLLLLNTSNAVCCKLFDLEVEPLSSLRSTGFTWASAKTISAGTHGIEPWALITRRQNLGATIRLTGCLKPEIGVNQRWICSIISWVHTNSRITDIAPVGAILSHIALAISTRIDHKVRWVICLCHEVMVKWVNKVQFVVGWVPLWLQMAWVGTASVRLMLVVQAVIVSGAIIRLPGAHFTQGLIVGNVGGETSEWR